MIIELTEFLNAVSRAADFAEAELPDGFICPRCRQPGSSFERV